MPLKINPEYSKLVPRPSAEDYAALEASIIAHNGIFDSIKVNRENEILDGHTRYEICSKHGLDFATETVELPSVLDEKLYVVEANLRRRHLNDFQKAELIIPLEAIEAELAKQRQIELGKTHGEDPLGSFEHKGKARDLTAKKSGLSPTTYYRAKVVLDEASEELKQKCRKGKISINAAHIQVKRAKKHAEAPELPSGKFDVIYADPPWRYDFCLEGNPEEHYPEMSDEDICSLQVPSADNAILFLWATNPKIELALKVTKAWGFRYITNIVWVKNTKGLGYYTLAQHELLFICKKGDMPPPQAENRIPSVVFDKRENHSKKPTQFYDIIERMYPNRTYLELFSRREWDGWTSWGNQNEK